MQFVRFIIFRGETITNQNYMDRNIVRQHEEESQKSAIFVRIAFKH